MEKHIVQQLANELWQASQTGGAVLQQTQRHHEMTIEYAYAIQLAGRKWREDVGIKVVGAKIGLTSKAMQQIY